MKDTYIEESGMKFGPFSKDEIFHIEKSGLYQTVSDGVKIAEFALLRNEEKIVVVEARSSSPQPGSEVKFDSYIDEIYTKFINSFYLIAAIILKRHDFQPDEMPALLAKMKIKATEFRFVLVINGHQDEWLLPINDSLKAKFIPLQKTWKCCPDFVAVINDEIARAKQWIS